MKTTNARGTVELTDEQAMGICEKVGRTLVQQLDTPEVWMKVEQTVNEYLKSAALEGDAAELTDRLEWSVKVKLRK